MPNVLVRYPVDSQLTPDIKKELMETIALVVARELSSFDYDGRSAVIEPEEVEVDLVSYNDEDALRRTLVSMIISGWDYPHRLLDIEERLHTIKDYMGRVIVETFPHITAKARVLSVRFMPVQEGHWV